MAEIGAQPELPPVAAPDPPDALLMRCLAEGDRAALALLVQRHQARIWSLALRFSGHAQDADDIAQETFLRLWRSAATYQPTASFTTWLYRIVVNLCLDERRRRRRGAAELSQVQTEPPAPQDPAPLETRETARRVQQAVAELPERQRTALLLYRYQDMTYRQIAEVTGWSESAVESLLVRAHASLREKLADLHGS